MLGKKWNSGVAMAAQALLIYVWLTDLSALSGTDTYYSVHPLLGLALTGDINVGIALFHGFQIGLQVWILIACRVLCCLQGRKQWLIAVPALVLMTTMLEPKTE